jgi:hypothetical protein
MLRFRTNNNTIPPSTDTSNSSSVVGTKPIIANNPTTSVTSNNGNHGTIRGGTKINGDRNQRRRILLDSCCSTSPSALSFGTAYYPPIHEIVLGCLLFMAIVEVVYILALADGGGGHSEGGIIVGNSRSAINHPGPRSNSGSSLRGRGSHSGNLLPISTNSFGNPIDDYYQRPHINSGPPVPLIVGGSDGSGTRAVARLLEDLGVTMVVEDRGTLDVHAKELSGGEGWPGLVSKILNATHSPDYELDDLPEHIVGVASSELGSLLKNIAVAATVLVDAKKGKEAVGKSVTAAAAVAKYVSFGFKAPVSMLLLPFFRKELPAFKMLHVVRDGRDVAFSENHSPVEKFYDTYFPLSSSQRERALRANSDVGWDAMNQIKAIQLWNDWNRQVYEYGRRHVDGRTLDILVLRSEDLLDDTYATITKVADFVGSTKTPKELCCLSRRGVKDFGESHDRSMFDQRTVFDSADFEAIKGRFHGFVPPASNGAAVGSWEAIRQKMVQQHKRDNIRRRLLDETIKYDLYNEDGNESKMLRNNPRREKYIDSKVRSEHDQRDSNAIDFIQMSRFYKRKDQKHKDVRQRYGKWVGLLDSNPILSELLHQEGKDALLTFGYEPRRPFMDLKSVDYEDCDETVVCPADMV